MKKPTKEENNEDNNHGKENPIPKPCYIAPYSQMENAPPPATTRNYITYRYSKNRSTAPASSNITYIQQPTSWAR